MTSRMKQEEKNGHFCGMFMRHLLLVAVLLLSACVPSVDVCTRTATVPETTGSGASTTVLLTTTEGLTTETTTEVVTTTVRVTTTTTTTASTTCPSAMDLFQLVTLGNPPDVDVTLSEAGAQPFGTTITADCTGPVSDTSVYVTYDSGGPLYLQNSNNLPGNKERISLTCNPSGKWDVSITSTSGSVSGPVSTDGGILCYRRSP